MISVYLLLDCLRMSARLHICIFAHSPALHHLHIPKHKAQAQNATSNGGDASRVGTEKGGEYELC